ncbi:MAG: class I SAM-dependent methyltransferase [Gammaproteobacteria bacterium]
MEKEYHDNKYREGRGDQQNSGADAAYRFFWDLVGSVKDRRVLDFGCGNGWVSLTLAKEGAKVYGIDISGELISSAKRLAESNHLVSRVHFEEMACEDLQFPDNYFDLVLGSAILHHTDIERAALGISRVLKQGGRCVFIEPMNENFVLRLWRKITPWRRSQTERALSQRDLETICTAFSTTNLYFFILTSILTEGILVFFPKNRFISRVNEFLGKFDSLLVKKLPSLGKYCAVVVLELRKA